MTTRTLVLLRHSKSSWDTDDEDIDRPLSSRGRRDAEAAGRYLAERGLSFDVALVSPAARARQTWDGVRTGGVTADQVHTVDAIYERDADAIVAAVQSLAPDANTVLVIGHCPMISEAVHLVAKRATTGDWASLDSKYPTSGIAVVEVDSDWSALDSASGTLVAFAVPRG